MTHVTNYAVDRLAPELFEHLFDFVQRWTNLNLVSGPPLTLGKIYFDIFPEDNMPFWTVSCTRKRSVGEGGRGERYRKRYGEIEGESGIGV